ncbi:MAG: hypothetical protein JWP27_576 [Flaviaesturariibacter sp.]|nr:hypothetical protein [Flaviaesturariibacter sp.]
MKASFKFPSLLKLLDFCVTTKVRYFQMNREDYILVAAVSEAEVELAVSAYEAQLVSITRQLEPIQVRTAI